ncbi:MAG: hypothetical protein WC851_02580 [Candidatus Shapirobacteria bacterium]|jgi:hypothetical protein
MALDIFPEEYNTVPSDRLGMARMVATVVLVSSGNGQIAEAAGVVTYVKLGELTKREADIQVRLKSEIE